MLALGSGSRGAGTERPPVAVLVPTTYALDAFAELGVAGAGIGSVAGPVALLALAGLGLLAVSAPGEEHAMRQVLGMMWVDRRLLRRDHVGLFFTFLLPLVAAVLAPIDIAEGGTEGVGGASRGSGPGDGAVLGPAGPQPGPELRRYADREAAEALAVRRRDVSARSSCRPSSAKRHGAGPCRAWSVRPRSRRRDGARARWSPQPRRGPGRAARALAP